MSKLVVYKALILLVFLYALKPKYYTILASVTLINFPLGVFDVFFLFTWWTVFTTQKYLKEPRWQEKKHCLLSSKFGELVTFDGYLIDTSWINLFITRIKGINHIMAAHSRLSGCFLTKIIANWCQFCPMGPQCSSYIMTVFCSWWDISLTTLSVYSNQSLIIIHYWSFGDISLWTTVTWNRIFIWMNLKT